VTTRDFSTVTELPGIGATREQLSMLYTRYHLAARHCEGKAVLELACGAGLGLHYISRRARHVVGGDIDEKNLRLAREINQGQDRVTLCKLDAQSLPFAGRSFDTVILYEALYYLPNPEELVREVRRVLRAGGVLLICTVNKEWGGFNPSPGSVRYFSAAELARLLEDTGFRVTIFGGFPDNPNSPMHRFVSALRKTAVRLRLIPKTMKGKQWLKRLFYGTLTPLRQVEEGMAPLAALKELPANSGGSTFKVLYAVASVVKESSVLTEVDSEGLFRKQGSPSGRTLA
jgi:ubiquinone/menaquinone biosynthesis C-methylase UbiE